MGSEMCIRDSFVRLADEAHSLDGSTPGDSYLDIGKIVAAAEKSGADLSLIHI